ncbi:MAG TPA: hypothetical protein VFA29_07820 [Candidatus Baltobacteraceae bacterium]|nr:hypothetical protein [Candidatus Baltobacteraceae bacterium]
MQYDTMETAYAKARDAQRRGLNTIDLALPAGRHTMALRVDVASIFTEGVDCGCDGLVTRRLYGEPFRDEQTGAVLPGRIETLVVRVSVADVLDMARAAVEREIRPLSPVRRMVRKRSLAHLMSR